MTQQFDGRSSMAQTGHSEGVVPTKDSSSDAFALATRRNFVVGGLVGLAVTGFGSGCAQHRQYAAGNAFAGSAHGQPMGAVSVPNPVQHRVPQSQEHSMQLDSARARAIQKQLPVAIFHSSVGLNSSCVQGCIGGEAVMRGDRGSQFEFSLRRSDGSIGTLALADLDAWGSAATRQLADKGIRGPLFIDPLTCKVYRVDERLALQDINRAIELDRLPVDISLAPFRLR